MGVSGGSSSTAARVDFAISSAAARPVARWDASDVPTLGQIGAAFFGVR
jgi:hypothetical protein